jgi:hypothetical protein
LLALSDLGDKPWELGQSAVKLKDVKIAGNVGVEEDGVNSTLNPCRRCSRSGLDRAGCQSNLPYGLFRRCARVIRRQCYDLCGQRKPYIREVKIQGNSQVSREKIETALGVSARTVLDRPRFRRRGKVRKLCAEQGCVSVVIDSAVSVEANNQASVLVDVTEGERLLISVSPLKECCFF